MFEELTAEIQTEYNSNSKLQEYAKREKKLALKAKPKTKRHIVPKWPKLDETLLFSFDTEYQLHRDGSGNEVLCYTFSISHKGKSFSGYIPVFNGKRLRFDKFVALALKMAIDKGVLSGYPSHVFVIAHNMKADIFNFKGAFEGVGAYLTSIRRTVVTTDKIYGVDIERELGKRIDKKPLKFPIKSRNYKEIYIRFYDTMLLAPAGKSLADLGDIVKVPKMDIPEGYSIERMAEFQSGDLRRFKQYAIRDAVIARLYIEKMIEFCIENGLSRLPLSVGAIAVKLFTKWLAEDGEATDINTLFGYELKQRTYWFNPTRQDGSLGPGSVRTLPKRVPNLERLFYEQIAILGYHGGRNEAFWMGLTPVGQYYDFDIPSCYTACMVGLREIDYEASRQVDSIEDLDFLLGDVCSIASVEFEFPEDTRYPCLPVRMESGLVFPLSGQSVCTGHEIEVALNLGVKVKKLKGFIFPWKHENRIFETFVTKIRDHRLSHKAKSFLERLWKEIGNSLYGKQAQGLRGKNGFDVESGLSEPLPYTALTNPFYSAYVTGLARAVLGEMLASIDEKHKVISVTTDGFITTAPLSEIPLDGPVCSRFRDLYHLITKPDKKGKYGEILEQKHGAKQLICAKTRGQITVIPDDNPKMDPIIAKAGVKVPDEHRSDEMKYMIDLYFSRHPKSETDASHLTSTRDMYLYELDMIMEKKTQRLNLEFDFKRMPVNPDSYVAIGNEGEIWEHVGAETVPFDTVDDSEFARAVFKGFRDNHCIKSVEDADKYSDFLAMCRAKSHTRAVSIQGNESSADLLVRLFLRRYSAKALGLTTSELSQWLEAVGILISKEKIQRASSLKVVTGVVPKTALSLRTSAILQENFSDIEIDDLFNQDS